MELQGKQDLPIISQSQLAKPGLQATNSSRGGSSLAGPQRVVSSLHAATKPASVKFEAREDQEHAIENVHQGFKEHDRGQLILPCGTGKTLTGLWIKEKEDAKTTIVAVPSIALIKQTKDAWQEQKSKDFDYLCICSDNDVDSSGDSVKVSSEELDQDSSKVTTDVNDIKKFLKKSNGDKVIYTTYQSLPKLMSANKLAKVKFDLALIDEAHKTTGKHGERFTLIHDNQNLDIKKRLYMTATPKIASDSVDGELVADMSNEEIYGPEFHRMSFGEAIAEVYCLIIMLLQ
jgi:predicted helicase